METKVIKCQAYKITLVHSLEPHDPVISVYLQSVPGDELDPWLTFLFSDFIRMGQLLQIEGVARSAQGIPAAVSFSFLDRSHYCFFQVAPQLSSRG
jgi:hypothetical protein